MQPIADPVEILTRRIWELTKGRLEPLLIAIDGRSGAGKSTLASAVSMRTGAAVINGDDFYAGGSAEMWDAMTPLQMVEHCMDWRSQRAVLEELSQRRTASWLPYDWEADNGSRSSIPLTCQPTDVVILEGAYSARPELGDLLTLRVLLDTPPLIRRQRLLEREGERYRAEWEARWACAEEHYFKTVIRAGAFDLVIQPQGG
jgi:para-aminobenzoate synthetase